MYWMNRWRLGLLMIFAHYILANGQTYSKNYLIDSYSMEQGLSQNSVYSITESTNGLIWLATHDGLNSFDGHAFRKFTPDTKDGISRSSTVLEVYKWKDDLLIVCTNDEVLIFDTKTNHFHPLNHYKIAIADKLVVKKCLIDSKNNIYVLSAQNGLYLYENASKKTYHYFNKEQTKDKLSDIASSLDGKIFVATDKTIFEFTKSEWTPYHLNVPITKLGSAIKNISFKNSYQLYISFPGLDLILANVDQQKKKLSITQELRNMPKDITSILLLNNSLWLGSRSNGITIKDSFGYQIYNKVDKFSDVAGNFILALFKDSKSNVWIGYSGAGLQRWKKQDFVFERKIPSTINAQNDNMILSMYSNDENNYYMGTLIGGLLHYIADVDKYQYHYNPALSSSCRNIYGFIQKDRMLYMATWAGLCSYDMKSHAIKLYANAGNKLVNKLYSIVQISNTPYLLLSGENGLAYFNTSTMEYETPSFLPSSQKLPILIARKMWQADSDNIYMCTSNENFVIYNIKKNEFRKFDEFQKFASSSTSFTLDKDEIYISTNRGLIKSNTQTWQIEKTWTQENGLSNSYIYAVVKDKNNDLWLSTNNGISQIDHATFKVYNYTEKDGIQSREFNTNASYISPNKDKIIFGGINGFNIINVNDLHRKSYAQRPLLTNIKLNNVNYQSDTAVSHLHKVMVDQNQNFISFEFHTPNPDYINELSYKYKLVGIDEDWVDGGKRNFASYNSLKPGQYNFLVKSYDSYGNVSAMNNQLSILVNDTWWKSWWLILFLILAAGALFFLLIRSRWLYEKDKHEMDLKLSEIELESLQTNISPHFIFNTLNSVYALFLEKDDQAATQLNKFATFLRATLEQSHKPVSSMKACLEQLKSYIDLEKLRHEELTAEFNIDPNLKVQEMVFPSNTLQLIMEHLLMNHFRAVSGEKTLSIYLKKVNENFATIEFWGQSKTNTQSANSLNKDDHISLIEKKIDLFRKKYQFELHLYQNTAIQDNIHAKQLLASITFQTNKKIQS